MTSNKKNSPSDPTRVGRKNGSHPLRRDVNLDAVDGGSGEHPALTMEPRLECLETVAVLRSLNEAHGCTSTGQCWTCFRVFRGSRGRNMHLSKSECGEVVESPMHRTPAQDVNPGPVGNPESIVVPVPGEPESSSSGSGAPICNIRYAIGDETAALQEVKERLPIKWPLMKDTKRWDGFQSKVSTQLPVNMSWTDRLNLLQNVIYDEAVMMFGCVDPGARLGWKKSRREAQLARIRVNIRALVRRLKVAPQTEKYGIEVALEEEKSRRNRVRKAENGRKRRAERRKLRKSFYQNPFKASKEMVSPRVPTQLKVSKETLDEYVRGVASDPDREVELSELPGLPDIPALTFQLNTRPFTLPQLEATLKRKKSTSRPGPNQIPYKVYKKCPRLKEYLFDILNSALRKKDVPICWRLSDGIMIPKVDTPQPSEVGDFRQIALLNVEGKLFWSLVADRLYNYLVKKNHFVSPTIQKGSMRKVAGCWEHTAMVWSALKEARTSRRTLAILWLDLANAYGSVPHKLIQFALRRYLVPEDWIDLIMAYYDGLWGRTTSSGISSDWMRYERGIFAGCTISVILFIAAFNVILEYVGNAPIEKFAMSNGSCIEILRGFMDDVSILTGSVPAARKALERTETVVAWARMSLKPSKSRSLVLQKGRCVNPSNEVFVVDGVAIPSLQDKSLRTLGRVYDTSISDRHCKAELEVKVVGGLKKLDRCHARGAMKLWALHHILLEQVRWDLMVYELPVSFVEGLEKTVNRFTRKWLGICRNVTDVALYSKRSPCPLPLQSLVHMFKATKVNSHLQLLESAHAEVAENVAPSGTGRKWKLCERSKKRFGVILEVGVLRQCEVRLEVSEAVGRVGQGRMGLDFAGGVEGSRSKVLSRRQKLVGFVREEMEEEYWAKACEQSVQGKWTLWKDFNQRVITWRSIVYADPKLVRFCIGSTYDTLASPANLKRWGLSPNSDCPVCKGDKCTIAHVLSGCSKALGQGRYRYRHDCVLRVLCHHVAGFINNRPKVGSVQSIGIQFVPAGSKARVGRKPGADTGLLLSTKDWVFLSDLDRKLVFPPHIYRTLLRPDIVIYGVAEKVIIMVELTCPCEENIAARHEEKLTRYSDLAASCRENGWRVHLFAVEVGARGFTAQSLTSCLRALGLKNRPLKNCVKAVGDEALRTSFWIWHLREQEVWGRVGFSKR